MSFNKNKKIKYDTACTTKKIPRRPPKKKYLTTPSRRRSPPQVYNVLLFIDEKLFDYPNQHSYNYDQ